MVLPVDTKLLIKETVNDTIEEVFLRFGVDTSTPEGILALQKDWHYVRSARVSNENVKTNTSQHVLNVVVSGLLAALVLGAIKLFNG